jgi:hypothetical protein
MEKETILKSREYKRIHQAARIIKDLSYRLYLKIGEYDTLRYKARIYGHDESVELAEIGVNCLNQITKLNLKINKITMAVQIDKLKLQGLYQWTM